MAGVPFPFPFPLPLPFLRLQASQQFTVWYLAPYLYIQRHERKLKMIILVNFKIRVLFYVAMLFFMKIQ